MRTLKAANSLTTTQKVGGQFPSYFCYSTANGAKISTCMLKFKNARCACSLWSCRHCIRFF